MVEYTEAVQEMKYLTLKQVAAVLQVGERVFRGLLHAGKIPGYRVGQVGLPFRVEDIDETARLFLQ